MVRVFSVIGIIEGRKTQITPPSIFKKVLGGIGMSVLLIRDNARRHLVVRTPAYKETINMAPFTFSFDPRETMVTNEGDFACLKCMTKLQLLWKRDDRGEFFCESCKDYKGNFRSIGYVDVLS